MVMEKQTVYSERVRGYGRTYFLDVRTAGNGSNYLSVTESRKDKEKEGEYKTSNIMIFNEDVDAFYAALGRTVQHFHDHRQSSGNGQ